MMLRRGEDHARIEDLGQVAADDELREHMTRVVRESLAALRRARQLTQRRGSRRRLIMIAAVASIAASVLLVRRRQAHQQADLDNQAWSSGEDRSGPAENDEGFGGPSRPVDAPDASDAATAPLPAFIPAPDPAIESTEP
jgi:hypothetical protein